MNPPLNKVNIRAVFNLLNSFDDKNSLFESNNKPRNELKFISKNNFNITLLQIHEAISDILNLFDNVGIEKFKHSIRNKTSIYDVLCVYKTISKINKFMNIKEVYEDKIDIDEFFSSIDKIITLNKNLETVDKINGIEILENKILEEINPVYIKDNKHIKICNIEIQKALNNLNNLKNINIDKLNLNSFIVCSINSIGDYIYDFIQKFIKKYFNNNDIDISELSKIINLIDNYSNRDQLYELCHNVDLQDLELFKSFITQNYQFFYDLASLLKNDEFNEISLLLNEYIKKCSLYKFFYKIPKIQKKYIDFIKCFFTEDYIVLKKLYNILKNTNYTFITLYNLHQQYQKPFCNPFETFNENDKINILNNVLGVVEILNKYNIKGVILHSSLDDITSISNKIYNDFCNYEIILKQNINLMLQYPELVTTINKNIQNIKIHEVLTPLIAKYSKYIYANNDREDFIIKAENIQNFIDLKKIVKETLKILNIDYIVSDVSEEYINNIIETLKKYKDLFSKEFINIENCKSIYEWYDRVKNIQSFENIGLLQSFVKQNKFIFDLKQLLGKSNEQIITDFLKNDEVSYDDFCEQISNNLIKTKFNNICGTDKNNILDEYFVEYRKKLKNVRKNYLLKGLTDLYSYTYEARDAIKKESNWRQATTGSDRFLLNTKLIMDVFPIFVATSNMVSRYILPQKNLFDYVIFDESSQLLPGQALPSIYRAKKAIIVGDPHQMPPPQTTFISDTKSDEYYDEEDISNTKSILDLAIDLQSEGEHYLQVHYRSENNMLFEPSRKAIYEKYGVQPIFEAGNSEVMPISVVDNIGVDDNKNFDIITEYIKSLYLKDPNATFCLLFTNKEKFDAFENDYRPNTSFYSNIENQLLVSTVTNCQGLECEHSIIYFNHYDRIGNMWFFSSKAGSYKRLNVSITRQRKSLKLFIADSKDEWLSQCNRIINESTQDEGRVLSAQLLKTVIETGSYKVTEQYIDELLKDNSYNIDSPLTQQLYDKLCEYYKNSIDKDIKIYCEVGWLMRVPNKDKLIRYKKNIGFRIDIGIYSISKKCFVLGIEMDGATYHSGYIKQFSDSQRQEILESKGWDIYRIWSTNWLDNTSLEFQKLINKISTVL